MSTPAMSTRAAAKLLEVKETHLHSLLRRGAIPAPSRDAGGRLIWRGADIEAARSVLTQRQTASIT